MSFLVKKFFEAASVIAKRRAVSRNPRQFQLETDINRLFLLTCYNRLGKEAEDADIEEIIDMGNKAAFADQQTQVQENIHMQIQRFCTLMDDILAVRNEKEEEPLSQQSLPEASVSPRPSGLRLAIGSSGDSLDDHSVVPKTKPLDSADVSRQLKNLFGYTLDVRPSQVPHEGAGQGLFVNGEVGVGSVVAFYPGMVYAPAYYRYIPGYPRVDADNPYLIARYDGTVINAKPWGSGGRTRQVWKGQPNLNHDVKQFDKGSDRFWKLLSKPLDAATAGDSTDVLELRNPLALGHYANHPGKGMVPNVMVCPYDFPLTEKDMRVYIPNVMFGKAETSMKRYGHFWFKSWRKSTSLDAPVLQTLLLVATKDLCDEEVLVNYRLSNSKRRPLWYYPVDEDEDSRRWS